MAEPERAEEFREAIAKMPSRSFRPTKKQGASGLAVLLAIGVGVLRLSTLNAQSHHRVDNTAYLTCVAQHETAALGETGSGIPGADPSLGFPDASSTPISTGEALAQADTACAEYPH